MEQLRQETAPADTDAEASALAAEIDAMRRRLAIEEDPDRLTGMEDRDSQTQAELDSIQRSLQIAREEAAAQRQAEEEAARLAAEEEARLREQERRLTQIAREATRQIQDEPLPEAAAAAAAASAVYPPQDTENAAEGDEDLEAELRRLIFSDLEHK